jgi:hypothetical protein
LLTNKFVSFQLHPCRVIRTTGDISTPRINGKPATPLPCCQQITKKAIKGRGKKPCPPNFIHHFLTSKFVFFSISSLQGSSHNWGYLRPQN